MEKGGRETQREIDRERERGRERERREREKEKEREREREGGRARGPRQQVDGKLSYIMGRIDPA
jgi:hypothetical protein